MQFVKSSQKMGEVSNGDLLISVSGFWVSSRWIYGSEEGLLPLATSCSRFPAHFVPVCFRLSSFKRVFSSLLLGFV